jgi:parallel beta-helix repeat protein
MKNFLIMLAATFLPSAMAAQSVLFPDDEIKRGYFDRPYKRYEAEPQRCESNGLFLSPTYTQSEIQSEASNNAAVTLSRQGDYVEWTNDEAADGLTLRFSIPDAADGRGLRGSIALYVNGKLARNIGLDSRWAWQYALASGQTYPDNLPAPNKFARMRFDETRVKLDAQIPQGATFRLVKNDDGSIPYTIDFVELEPVPQPITFESLAGANKIVYNGSEPLDKFVAANGGKTIFIPAGRYEVANRILISEPNTALIGAGMWHVELYFSAPPDNADAYARRGIQSNAGNTALEGLYITTANERRYFVHNGRNGQVGKGLMGSFGKGSRISSLWIEHFECGGWIDGADDLTVERCRFRNNYADGINLSFGSRNSTVEHCSFRNNGDDDMASWSRGETMCENIAYRYCTAENNWRASSVGFFGGGNHKALDIVVIDPMEAALRVTTDFPGREFSSGGEILFSRISVYKGGCSPGPLGFGGDIINGSPAGAIHITSYLRYNLRNVRFSNIDLYDSKYDAIFIGCDNDKIIENLRLENIRILGAARYGISFSNAAGNAIFRDIVYERTEAGEMGEIDLAFSVKIE